MVHLDSEAVEVAEHKVKSRARYSNEDAISQTVCMKFGSPLIFSLLAKSKQELHGLGVDVGGLNIVRAAHVNIHAVLEATNYWVAVVGAVDHYLGEQDVVDGEHWRCEIRVLVVEVLYKER